MKDINYFADCLDTELVYLWQIYKAKGVRSKHSCFHKYLNKYEQTLSRNPALLCELDFLKTCAERFYQKTFNELIE